MKTFRDIQGKYREEIDYHITLENRGGAIIILAPHGGGIERGTSEIANAIAGDDLSYYIFKGLMSTAHESRKLHIISTRFDEPRCLEIIRGFRTALAIHGCCGSEQMIYVGGNDNELKWMLITELGAKGHPVQLGTEKYAGSFPSNICNRTSTGKGVQIELSNGLRRLLFDNWQTRKGRKITTNMFDELVFDIRESIG